METLCKATSDDDEKTLKFIESERPVESFTINI